MRSYCIVMTACIDPAGGGRIRVHRNNPDVRLLDYKQALEYWLRLPDPRIEKIVFVENSGYPLDALKVHCEAYNPKDKQVEFLSFCCNNYPEGVHYGYAELDMLDKAVASSRLIAKSDCLIKTTGRLTFPAISKLLDRLPPEYLFVVDCRDKTPFKNYLHPWTTTQLMVFSTRFYKQYIYQTAKLEFGGGVTHLEDAIYRRLVKFKEMSGAIYRFPINVDPVGFAAHWEKNYRSPKQRLLNSIRAAIRKIYPRMWL